MAAICEKKMAFYGQWPPRKFKKKTLLTRREDFGMNEAHDD
jgi:hypothetical protein